MLLKFLIDLDCEQSVAYPTLYVLMRDYSFVIFVIYVDDVLMFSISENNFDYVLRKLEENFDIRTTSSVDRFLGFSIKDEGDGG